MSESFARTICGWTDKLPQDCRQDADAILLGAAKGGADLPDLAALAGEIYARSLPENPDKDRDEAFEERSVRLEATFGGAGVLNGDLSPECASIVGTVLDALSAPAGAEDTRSQAQRYHDGLHEAMWRLRFCIMMDSWTARRQTGPKPSSGRADVYARLSEIYDAAESVPHPDRARHRPTAWVARLARVYGWAKLQSVRPSARRGVWQVRTSTMAA